MRIKFNMTYENGNTLVSEPDGAIDGRYEYEFGRTVVKVTETNMAGSSKSCIFHVRVLGMFAIELYSQWLKISILSPFRNRNMLISFLFFHANTR